jgi:outer membrane receptor protein involved in Fe transport
MGMYEFGGALAPLTATASVRNLFNRDYQESIGFPAPPAWFVIGLRYAIPLASL